MNVKPRSKSVGVGRAPKSDTEEHSRAEVVTFVKGNPRFDEPGGPQLRRAMCGLVAQVAVHLLPTTHNISDEDAFRLLSTEWTATKEQVELEIARRLNLTTHWGVVVKRDDDGELWDISSYEKTKDALATGMSSITYWEVTREAIKQRGVLMGVVADMMDSMAALDRNAVALIESHNVLAAERAVWKERDRDQKNTIRELKLELTRAMKQPVRTTESADRPCSDCENTRSERRVAEDLQRMSMNQTATLQVENQALEDEIRSLRSQRTPTAATEFGQNERRSAKIPDPAQLDDAADPTYESWKGAISDKLSINEDWFTSERAKVAYVCSRTKGKALRHLDATRTSDGSRTLGTVAQILAHLDLIFLDPNRGYKAREAFGQLRMTHTGFQEFRTSFYELSHRGGLTENLKEEFYRKLPQEFQSHLCTYNRDGNVTLAQLADAAAGYEPVSSWTRSRAKFGSGKASGTTPVESASKKAQPANPAPRQLSPELQRLKELGACYKCKQRGHLARDCTQQTGVSVVAKLTEVTGNEEA
ncbi:hypothetical protein E4U14_008481 [Claviceps sp. LM454 group G7]|nr:hypothetical protein E4U14_008481 [Claviceps sp. LM454 group G7]